MRTTETEIQRMQQDLEKALPGQVWLKLLEVFVPSGVADNLQIRAGTGMNRDKLSRALDKLEAASAGFPPILHLLDHAIPRFGVRGRAPSVYSLGPSGAELLVVNGHPGTLPCELKTDHSIAHALSMLSLHLAAWQAGLTVFTDSIIPFGEQKSIRPDHRILLSDGRSVIYEIEQESKHALIPRMLESLTNKQAFFQSSESHEFLPEVRMVVNLPRGTKWSRTLNVWRECCKLLVDQGREELAFLLLVVPMDEFLQATDWGYEVSDRWQDLTSQKNMDEARSGGQEIGPVSSYELNHSAAKDNIVLKALLQEYNENIIPNLPQPDFGMFDVIYTIYSASNSAYAYSSELPHESIYLLKRYLEIHPTLIDNLRRTLHQGKGHIRWNHLTIVHRMQKVINCFLAYHGWQSGRSLKVNAVSDGWSGSGNFGAKVDIRLKFGDYHEWEEFTIYKACEWVLWALFEYSDEIGIGRPEFW
jgi:hypothetical protein